MEPTSDHRYEILATLGRGGFGTVYRARFLGEAGFSKQVALKILNDRMAGIENVASRLRDEARMLGLLEHRAIVRVDRLVQINGRWAVVMEYVRGVDLGVLLETGPVPPRCALEIVSEVASALAEAFEGKGSDGTPLGLVHRDIKPDNILVTPSGDVKVLDFGIARAEFSQREAYTSDLRFGSPAYMAPERFDQSEERPDESSTDVYSLGTVLYEMVLGEPFARTSPIESRHQRFLDERIAKMRRTRVPDELVDLIEEMMAYDRAKRPSSRNVERRALKMIASMEGPQLRFWAEERVPPLVQDGKAITNEISRFLDEDSTAVFQGPGDSLVLTVEPTRTSVPAPPRRSLVGWLVLAVVVAVAGVGGGALTQAFIARGAAVAEPMAPLPVPSTPAAAEEPPGEVEAIAPEPETPETPETPPAVVVPVPGPASTPAPRPSSVTAAPGEDEPHATVHIKGDARKVVVVGVRERFAVPGRVPPGRYTVAVDFGSGSLTALQAVTVGEGEVLNLRCDSLLESCASY